MCLTLEDLPSTDPAPLEWWAGRVEAGKLVRSWLPDVFERYARILHPVYAREETPEGMVHRLVTWRELERWSGKPFTPQTGIHDLAVRSDGSSWSERGALPHQGELDPKYLRRLVGHLATTDVAEDVWFLVWAGYGQMRPCVSGEPRPKRRITRMFASARREEVEVEVEVNPSFRGTGRTYFLFRGAIRAPAEEKEDDLIVTPVRPMRRPPSFWWPAHRRWFVSTDIDSYSTYVGGSATLIERLLEDHVLEAVPVGPDEPYDPCESEGNRGGEGDPPAEQKPTGDKPG